MQIMMSWRGSGRRLLQLKPLWHCRSNSGGSNDELCRRFSRTCRWSIAGILGFGCAVTGQKMVSVSRRRTPVALRYRQPQPGGDVRANREGGQKVEHLRFVSAYERRLLA